MLDAAEGEFSAHGFDGVTLRAIAKRADVDLALPNYYFGPKHQLFEAVLMRRAEIVNQWREDALAEAIELAKPNPPTVESIIRAYMEPMLTGPHVEDQGWKNYYALVAYVNNAPGWGGRLMAQHFDQLIRKFLDALRLALPGMNEKDLYWGYNCFSGALTLALAQTGRIDHLSGGVCHSDDLADACEHMVHFITGGFEAARRAAPAVQTQGTPRKRKIKNATA
ncbi:TetR/AcrR family transcriptional regulator [Hyphomonas sp.]|uniref:TetR/AcrR family transcriptional regulator n=1 Tax=Hyphomonas sp. TaxID=87 RepID=UPI0032EFEC58